VRVVEEHVADSGPRHGDDDLTVDKRELSLEKHGYLG
jgi:hypothetical protein